MFNIFIGAVKKEELKIITNKLIPEVETRSAVLLYL
jgi:hypothetical protein